MKDKNTVTEMTTLMKKAGYEWPFIVGVLEAIMETNMNWGNKMEHSIEYWIERCTDEISKKDLGVSV
jgi:hypothetical protein